MILIAMFLILFEAIPEALALKGHKTTAGVIESIYRIVITVIVFLWLTGTLNQSYGHNIYFIIGGYVLLRFAIFDIVFNLIAELPVFFIGSTKLFDKFWQWFFATTKFPVIGFLAMIKFICLCIGLTWLITK